MVSYRPRLSDRVVEDSLSTFGAVILQGPRAVGKTTSGLHFAESSVRLDANPEYLEVVEASPRAVLPGAVPRLIDEWQLVPSIWNVVRHEVDSRQVPGQFILTGSAVPADDITRHSGAGRFRRVTLRPMTLSESGDGTGAVPFSTLLEDEVPEGLGGPEVPDYAASLVRGGWPALVAGPSRSAYDYLSAYLEDLARVDLPQQDFHADPVRMAALMRAVARNTSTEISVAKLAQEAQLQEDDRPPARLSQKTAHRYLDALSRTFVVEEQPAWPTHLRSKVRLRKQPKWHFVDPSLAAAALEADAQRLLSEPKTFGLLFESLAIRDLRVHAEQLRGSVYHYRDESGLEVDAVVQLPDGRWAAFEVKLGGKQGIGAASQSLHKLARKVSEQRREELVSLNVITAGAASYRRPDGVNVVALGHLCSE